MVIRAIVYAENKDKAQDKAETVFERLVEDTQFDYYVSFDKDGMGMSGKDRWVKLPAVAEATSRKGKKLIDEGMQFTKVAFTEAMKEIRFITEKYSDKDIFEEKDKDSGNLGGFFKHYVYRVGQYRGSSVWLYDSEGEGIKRPTHLKGVLEKWKCLYEDEGKENPYEKLKVYVVPADVHY